MKKLSLLVLVPLLFLVGCSNKTDEPIESTEPATVETSTQSSEPAKDVLKVENGPLMNIGEYSDRGNYKVTLLDINSESETTKIDNLEISLKDSKILEYSGEGALPDDLAFYLDGTSYPFNLLQIQYKVTNNSDDVAYLSGINSVVLGDGKQHTPFNGQLIDSIVGASIQPHAYIDGLAFVPIDKADISSYKINWGPTLDEEGYHITETSDTLNIKF